MINLPMSLHLPSYCIWFSSASPTPSSQDTNLFFRAPPASPSPHSPSSFAVSFSLGRNFSDPEPPHSPSSSPESQDPPPSTIFHEPLYMFFNKTHAHKF